MQSHHTYETYILTWFAHRAGLLRVRPRSPALAVGCGWCSITCSVPYDRASRTQALGGRMVRDIPS
eukprot:1861770-Amphidinium_carterae.1